MRAFSLLHFLLLSATAVKAGNAPEYHGLALDTVAGPAILVLPRDGPEGETAEPAVVHRCRAEEFSPGTALNVIILLATACVIHMPGSLVAPRSARLYRLAPELGIWDAMSLLFLVGEGLLLHGRSLKISATSALMLRHFSARGDHWWRRGPSSGSEAPAAPRCLECAEGFLHRVQRYRNGRPVVGALVLCAVIKAFAAKGTLTTSLLAASYALSFFTIEFISLAALHTAPPATLAEREQEALEYTELVTLLDSDGGAWRDGTLQHSQAGDGRRRLREAFKIGVFGVYGLAAALLVFFPPFSIPIFVLFEFQVTHSANGKWVFYYLTSLAWLFWIVVAGSTFWVLVYASAFAMWRGDSGKREEQISACMARVTGLLSIDEDSFLFNLYSVFKFALILRFYIGSYTGQGTTKNDWLQWLG